MTKFVAGPCVIESAELLDCVAERLVQINNKLGVDIIFKASFDKANRTSLTSYRGVGLDKGLQMLSDVKSKWGLKLCTDIHEAWQAAPAGEVIDVIQIPAFLCRQTDLILAAAATMKPVNIKKGQFLAPWEMENVLKKAKSTGNDKISLCERGTSFGYGNLVVDMRGLEIMKRFAPVVFDATHSVQLPGAQGSCSGGQREFVPALARAAAAIGVAGIFMEVHPDPDKAPCDGPNMLPLKELPAFLKLIKEFDALAKGAVA